MGDPPRAAAGEVPGLVAGVLDAQRPAGGRHARQAVYAPAIGLGTTPVTGAFLA
jgi:hypothetical protein